MVDEITRVETAEYAHRFVDMWLHREVKTPCAGCARHERVCPTDALAERVFAALEYEEVVHG